MERLTTDKPKGMYELAHNGCYIDENRNARYRDFETDIDAREWTRDIMRGFGLWEIDDDEMLSDEIFDETIMDNLQYGTKELEGLIALFYRNLWAMAELKERLKHYEDLEEQGLLLKLPFPLGTKRLYWIDMSEEDKEVYQLDATDFNIQKTDISDTIIYTIDDYDFVKSDFGKSVFLTKEEAEAKLKEMEGES